MESAVTRDQIRALLEAKNFPAVKAAVSRMEVHGLAALLGELEGEDLAVAFRLLPQQTAAEVFGDLPLEGQEQILRSLSSERVATILNEMPPDERTELLEELPGELAQRLLSSLRGEELRIARSLLAYPEDSVGRLMTPEYLTVRPDWSVRQVFAHIRSVGATKETLNVIYVIDEAGRLLDDLRLEQIVLADPDASVADLMDRQVACLRAGDDKEGTVEIFRKYDAVALPVVDATGVLVGIVTVDDVIDVAEEENTEDFQKMAAVEALEVGYLSTSFLNMMRKRLPWLVLLFLAEILTVLALSSFAKSIDVALLAMAIVFAPLINACAGNAGSQTAGLMIRGLALQEVDLSHWRRILLMELTRGLTLGLVLAGLAYPTSLVFGRPPMIAISVSAAMLIAVTFANVIGTMFPFFFKRIGVDPAVTSGPFIASLMDVTSIVIYFSIALTIVRIVGG